MFVFLEHKIFFLLLYFLTTCVLFCLFPSPTFQKVTSFSGDYSSAHQTLVNPNHHGSTLLSLLMNLILGARSLIATEKRSGARHDLLRTWYSSATLSQVESNCTPKSTNMRICTCPDIIFPKNISLWPKTVVLITFLSMKN